MTAALFDPLTVRGVTFRNRIWVSPMCQYMCLDEDGVPNDWHLVNAGTYAAGGAGLVMAEASGVCPEGRITAECAGIWNDVQRDSWARVVDFVHRQGARAGIQLAHSGRKGSDYRGFTAAAGRTKPIHEGGWIPVGPSPIACPGMDVPEALDKAGIAKVVSDFAAAARRAVQAGFDVVEVHAAHGYLLHQFLSPLSNHREDGYGGGFEGRTRLLREVVAAVRDVWPGRLPLFVRLSATDWVEGGWNLEQSVALAKALNDLGVDLVDCSSGGLVPRADIPLGPGYQVPFAARIRAEAGLATGAVGLITDPEQAEAILAQGSADLVLLGRELLRDPRWPLRAAQALKAEVPWPASYARAARGPVAVR